MTRPQQRSTHGPRGRTREDGNSIRPTDEDTKRPSTGLPSGLAATFRSATVGFQRSPTTEEKKKIGREAVRLLESCVEEGTD